ncbi:hypothetical protein Tco_1400741 [Tanacetum coccineum]
MSIYEDILTDKPDVPERTYSYIIQTDVHAGEMTVKETLDFAARCQGVGSRYELLTELDRREKEAGIFPEPEVDLFMKATAVEGVENSLITDYIIKIDYVSLCWYNNIVTRTRDMPGHYCWKPNDKRNIRHFNNISNSQVFAADNTSDRSHNFDVTPPAFT